jgi:hypothetical protein
MVTIGDGKRQDTIQRQEELLRPHTMAAAFVTFKLVTVERVSAS